MWGWTPTAERIVVGKSLQMVYPFPPCLDHLSVSDCCEAALLYNRLADATLNSAADIIIATL